LSVVVEQGQAPYTFLWADNATDQTRSGVAPGTYSVIIRDASGAEVSLEGTVMAPAAIETTAVVTPASCSGVASGAIDLSVSGGEAPYTYSWSNGATAEDIDGLPSGGYNVFVTDANGCTSVASFTVSNSSSIAVVGEVRPADCHAANGAIDLTVTGGTMPYIFSWVDGATTEDRQDLAGGVYIVAITDQNGCTAKATYVVNENNTLALTADVVPADCSDNGTGSIDITVAGGTAPYTYSWSN